MLDSPFFLRVGNRQLCLSTFSIQLSPLLLHATRHRATFFPQHCHRLSRDSLDSFAGAVFSPFIPPPLPFFPSLFVLVPRHLCLSAAFLAFLFPPAAHHVLQYRRAASGVTPVIRDGPDEAFIILSKRVSLPIRQHTVIIQSNG